MSKSTRALQELMTAVDAGNAADGNVDSASLDSSKLLGPRRRSTYNGRGAGGVRRSAPAVAVAVVEASTDASFEFSAVVNTYSSASPASMVFSGGQLRAHQFPAVRSAGNSQPATSPVRTSSIGSYSSTKQQQQAGVTAGSTKRASFATDGPGKAGGRQGKKSGGLLGCCPSSRNEAVEPVARNYNRKVEAF